jgi:hypothetical protein
MKGSSLVGSLVDPEQNIFFLTVHHFTSFVTIAQQAGQAVVSRRLSLNKHLCGKLWALYHKKRFRSGRKLASRWSLYGAGCLTGVCDRLSLELSIREKIPQSRKMQECMTH